MDKNNTGILERMRTMRKNIRAEAKNLRNTDIYQIPSNETIHKIGRMERLTGEVNDGKRAYTMPKIPTKIVNKNERKRYIFSSCDAEKKL
jgi:hypothetical protein